MSATEQTCQKLVSTSIWYGAFVPATVDFDLSPYACHGGVKPENRWGVRKCMMYHPCHLPHPSSPVTGERRARKLTGTWRPPTFFF